MNKFIHEQAPKIEQQIMDIRFSHHNSHLEAKKSQTDNQIPQWTDPDEIVAVRKLPRSPYQSFTTRFAAPWGSAASGESVRMITG